LAGGQINLLGAGVAAGEHEKDDVADVIFFQSFVMDRVFELALLPFVA
jgi:hypothetical protein